MYKSIETEFKMQNIIEWQHLCESHIGIIIRFFSVKHISQNIAVIYSVVSIYDYKKKRLREKVTIGNVNALPLIQLNAMKLKKCNRLTLLNWEPLLNCTNQDNQRLLTTVSCSQKLMMINEKRVLE